MNPIIPTQHNDDSMPREVATAILTEPKAKLTNTFHKAAKCARDRVFRSETPMLAGLKVRSTATPLFTDDAPAKPTPGAVKLRPKTVGQVGKWLRRVIARRLVVQAAAVKLDGQDTSKFSAAQLRARAFRIAVLEAQADALDSARDTLEDELTRRAGTYNP